MESLLTNDMLNFMRKIGDPRVDTVVSELDEGARQKLIKGARKDGLARFLKDRWLQDHARDYGIKDLLEHPGTLPDPDLVKTACDLFARYGSEIAAALLLAALPEAYAAGEGANVLARRSELIKGGTLSTRRILATAQFVILVLTPGTPDPPVSDNMKRYTYPSFDDTRRLWGASEGQALRASLALRIMHSLIRISKPTGIKDPALDHPNHVPLNQEDLLATLLSFSITVFEVLEQFGIRWSAEEQEAYFYVWDRVGETLGIGDTHVIRELTGTGSMAELKRELRLYDEGEEDEVVVEVPIGNSRLTPEEVSHLFKGPINRRVLRRVADVGTLRPQSVPEARALLARLRERMWTLKNDSFPQRKAFPYENFKKVLNDVSPGRILLKAMIDEVAARLPASQKSWPIAVIRQLVPPPVQNRLALGGTSSIGFLSGIFDTPRDSPGSVVLRRITAEVLRQRATRVADSLFLYYYDKGLLTIPGLHSAALGYGVDRSDPEGPND
jgi:hypothetical protein